MEGGCFCGALRYEVQGKPVAKGQCHCRACQQISGGAPNLFMLMPREGFRYTTGHPKTFRHPDSKAGVTREFCGECGTHVATRRDGLNQVILKIGTLDDPAVFRGPKFALFTAEKQAFHHIPDGVPGFPGFPNGM
jgi:hypothetical protein